MPISLHSALSFILFLSSGLSACAKRAAVDATPAPLSSVHADQRDHCSLAQRGKNEITI